MMRVNILVDLPTVLDIAGIPFTNIYERDGGIAIITNGEEWFIPTKSNDVIIRAVMDKALEMRKAGYL